MGVSVPIPRIVCMKDSADSTQWSAWCEDHPFRRGIGERPANAIHRFLEFNTRGAFLFDLVCDGELAGNGQTVCRMRWVPPDLLLICTDCRGSGTYTGFLAVEPCRVCEGRGVIRILC